MNIKDKIKQSIVKDFFNLSEMNTETGFVHYFDFEIQRSLMDFSEMAIVQKKKSKT